MDTTLEWWKCIERLQCICSLLVRFRRILDDGVCEKVNIHWFVRIGLIDHDEFRVVFAFQQTTDETARIRAIRVRKADANVFARPPNYFWTKRCEHGRKAVFQIVNRRAIVVEVLINGSVEFVEARIEAGSMRLNHLNNARPLHDALFETAGTLEGECVNRLHILKALSDRVAVANEPERINTAAVRQSKALVQKGIRTANVDQTGRVAVETGIDGPVEGVRIVPVEIALNA